MEIWHEIKEDQERGAKRLVAECGDRLYAAALLLCRDRSHAEDLVFRTMSRAIRRIGQYRETAPFYSWLYTILLNIHRSDMRKLKAEVLPSGTISDDLVPVWANLQSPITREDALAVREAVRALPSPFRETVLLRYFEDNSLNEIAEIMSVPVGTAKSRLVRALKRLNELLADLFKENGK